MLLNWNNFKAKFDGKENKAFESLAYQLFCKEFNIKKGIFRFKNQAGIETEPIEVGEDVVGFQAKYYETKISDNKKDIIDSLEKAKEKNPKLTKVLFYLNQEFSESSKLGKKDPKYKRTIEKEARKLGIEIEWRVPSHFEIQLALPENQNLRAHFFELGKSIFDFLDELEQHTEAILAPIHSEIKFSGKIIKLDREKTMISLQRAFNKSQIIILTGGAGVGKTAVVKDFYDKFRNKHSIYLFKAIEFKLNNINELFRQFGDFTFKDFIDAHKEENIDAHKEEKQKYIVIDSAENLSGLNNQEPFSEFLSTLIKNGWKVIFTIRYSYLESLEFRFVKIYHLPYEKIKIENISNEKITQLSKDFSFELLADKRLLDLIKVPFYLSEYLENYQDFNRNLGYSNFRELLWEKKIQNSSQRSNNIHIRRENCFLSLAKKRADSGNFYIPNSEINCDNETLQKLLSDEVIQYDKNYGGYFITHDVYEEWALEKIIEREFNRRKNNKEFFNNIGSSYPVRRAFRHWLSEKLFSRSKEIKRFIEEVITNDSIEKHWKDEILISVLLSNYSSTFFEIFEKELLSGNSQLFKRITFLLRVACKEVDDNMFKFLGINNLEVWKAKYVFTKPKGKGWEALIEFVYKHLDEIGLSKINIVLPVLYDWNSKNKAGETTKKASLIALRYYKKLQEADTLWRYDDKNKLIQVILYGALEIKDELKDVFEKILKHKWKNPRDPYYDLCEAILTTFDVIQVTQALPQYILKLADLFWTKGLGKVNPLYDYGGVGVEKYYCLNVHMDYFPPSASKTPIFWLLQFSPKETVDFILNFTNKCVECYVKSGFDKSIEKVSLIIDDKTTVKQYISNSLWNIYRGTSSPITPYLLQSIHMALEKFLLERAKNTDPKTLEEWLLYLLKNSKSSSITAVVTSITLAYPDKTFDIAKILFQTKEFFSYDINRQYQDISEAKILYGIGYGLNYQHKIYQDERLKTCEDKHRNWSLEDLIRHYQLRHYQLFRSEAITDEEVKRRREIIWKILDKHYNNLPDKSYESEKDKTWRLSLARMDIRKTKLTIESKDGQTLISLTPQIEPELKRYSEESINKSNKLMKHTPLGLWAEYKFENNKKYKEYKQYEGNIKLVLKETKEIVNKLNNKDDSEFSIFNDTVPAYTCAVLIRDYLNKLSDKEKEFCKNVLLKYAILTLKDDYQYQIYDGTEAAINTLPLLLKIFPSEKERIKTILLLTLFDSYPIGNRLLDYSLEAILNNLWDISFEDAQSIFLGYLLLKPRYDELIKKLQQENYKKGLFRISKERAIERFLKENELYLEKVINNKIEFNNIKNIHLLDLGILEVAFELIPINTNNEVHKSFIKTVLSIFAEKLLKDDNKINYTLKQRVFKKFAYFILNREKGEIKEYIQPFVDNFVISREIAEFFREIISAEGILNRYEQFWLIWDSFYDKIVELCKGNHPKYYKNEIIHNYLLAWPYWRKTAKEWHTLKEKDKFFFKKVTEDMGHCPAVLYSISKLLNEIGSSFIDDGILWISRMLEKNKDLWTAELETYTIYYLETIARIYYISNREAIKKDAKLKNKIIIILNFLVERASAFGFLLREEIL